MTSIPAGAPAAQDPMLHGINAAQRLIAALALHGLKLASVRGGYPVRNRGFVELGGCTAEVADALATVLEEAHEGK
ncbi:hypothetical protein [Kitasatospora sp. MAP5-34]|uniref:hypothetical protein n=1 Tax=Kitasatospora sp. MAP5-34 TaxID=3035102 RepID=UPI002473DB9F|nr:hypothetical protein [Kitasatospora sp. MAP5-34]MDH6580285.1 hypothetical protein [Kitasatospora sp. MAP5-34]